MRCSWRKLGLGNHKNKDNSHLSKARYRGVITLVLLFLLAASNLEAAETTLRYGRFGTVKLYQQSDHPSHVVLFVSGDGGWNKGVVDMARELSSLDALVVGIDITHYLKEMRNTPEKCSYPAADFEMLSKFIQKKLDFQKYVLPVLVGYSSGATLVYAIIVQSPPNTFHRAISLGFCPELLLRKPLCKGDGLEWRMAHMGKDTAFFQQRISGHHGSLFRVKLTRSAMRKMQRLM